MCRRVHFSDEGNLRLDRLSDECDECGSRKYRIYQKSIIFDIKLGDYCLNPDCDVDQNEIDDFEGCEINDIS